MGLRCPVFALTLLLFFYRRSTPHFPRDSPQTHRYGPWFAVFDFAFSSSLLLLSCTGFSAHSHNVRHHGHLLRLMLNDRLDDSIRA